MADRIAKLIDNELDFTRDGSTTNAKITATTSQFTYEGPASATVLVKNLTDPVDPQDSATKAYVDTAVTSVVSVSQNQFLVGDAGNQAVDQGSVLTFSTAIINGPVFTIGDSTTTTATFNLGSQTATTANVVINLSGGTGSSTIDHKGSGLFTISASNATTSNIVFKLGGTSNINSLRVRDSSDNDRFYIEMDGGIFMPSLRTGVSGANAIGIISNEIVDTVSLRKYKEDETLATEEPEYSVKDILKLEPKFFTWTASGSRDFGFIVEDALDQGLDQFVFVDPKQGPKNYKDRALIAGLLALAKEQHSVVEKQQKEIDHLKLEFSKFKNKSFFNKRYQ